MNQLVRNNLVRISRLASKLSLRTCSSQLTCLSRGNDLAQSNCRPTSLTVRNLSQTSTNLMQEKSNRQTDSKSEEPVIIAEIKEDDDNLVKKFFKRYGKLGIVIYLSVSISTIGILYLVLDWGVDISAIIEFFELSNEVLDKMKEYEGGGKFLVAYAISKALLPVRLSVSVALLYVLKNIIKIKF